MMSDDKDKCPRCEGCGQIANDDDGTPWTYWQELPPGSDLAIQMDLIKPITCPDCLGSGRPGGSR